MEHTPPALTLVAATLILFFAGTPAQAHRLDAQAFVLSDQRVQIESWFSSGDPARGAKVRVLRADRSLLVEGQLDEKGIFIFTPPSPDRLTVVISAGIGHRKELTIAAEDLARARSSGTDDPNAPSPHLDPVPLADRSAAYPFKDVLLGITFLLAAAAFVMSLRNQRRLKDKGTTPP
jgi:nickel transport protein